MGWNPFKDLPGTNLVEVAGDIIDFFDSSGAIRQNAEVAQFNRVLDILNLQILISKNDTERKIISKIRDQAIKKRQLAYDGAAYYETESSFNELQRDTAAWLTASRAREQRDTAKAESRVEFQRLNVENLQLDAQDRIATARKRTREAARGVLEQARGAATARTGIRRQRIQAERTALETGASIQRQTRQQEGRAERAAATTGAAARGVFSAATAAQRAQSLAQERQDLALQEAEKDARELALQERELDLQIKGGEATYELLRLEEKEVAAEAEAVVRGGQRGEIALRQQLGRVRARYGEEEAARIQARGEVEKSRYGLAAAGSRTVAKEKRLAAKDIEVDIAKMDTDTWYSEAASRMAQWQIDNVPKLPDYESASTRNLLNLGLDLLNRAT